MIILIKVSECWRQLYLPLRSISLWRKRRWLMCWIKFPIWIMLQFRSPLNSIFVILSSYILSSWQGGMGKLGIRVNTIKTRSMPSFKRYRIWKSEEEDLIIRILTLKRTSLKKKIWERSSLESVELIVKLLIRRRVDKERVDLIIMILFWKKKKVNLIFILLLSIVNHKIRAAQLGQRVEWVDPKNLPGMVAS